MSKSSKRRNRLGVFLAVLSLTTTAKTDFASAMAPYSDNQGLNAGKRVISDIEWGTILDRYDYEGVKSCKAVISEATRCLGCVRKSCDMLKNHTRSFENKLAEKHALAPGWWERFTSSSAVNAAADSIEQKTNSAYMSVTGYVGSATVFVNAAAEFLSFAVKAFPDVYAEDRIKSDLDNLKLNIVDLQSAVKDLPEEVENAKNSSGMERYNRYDAILMRLNSCLRLVKDANSKLDVIEEVAMRFVEEIGSLPAKIEARIKEREIKQKEEQARIDKEAQEKLEQEKKEAEEQRQKALEEAKRNKEEAEKRFLSEKSKRQSELSEILNRTDKEFEDMCESSDPDIGELLKKNQGNVVAEFRSSIEVEISILDDMKEYSEVNLQKVIDMKVNVANIRERKRNLDKSIKEYKKDLTKEKKELEGLKSEIVTSVDKLRSDLSLAWNEEIGKLVSDEDKARFVDMAKPSFESANKIIDQMSSELGQFKINLTKVSKQDLESLKSRMGDRMNKVNRSIDTIKNKGLGIRIVNMRDSVNTAFKARDRLWTEFKNKYEPSRMTGDLADKTSNIWKRIEASYNDEVKYSQSIDTTLKSLEMNEAVAARLDDILTESSNRLGAFRNDLRDAEEGMQEFLDKLRASRERQLSFDRVYSSGDAFDVVQNDVGSASANLTPTDSARIGLVVDGILPGTGEIARSCADAMRLGGYQAILVSGWPGWGKTELIKNVAAATSAKIIQVDYNEFVNGDGTQYAQKLIQSAGADSRPHIIMCDEFDTISRKTELGKPRPVTAANFNSFLNALKDVMDKGNTNIKLVYCASNEYKDNMDLANFNRMSAYYVLGDKPDYKNIILTLLRPVRVTSDAISKEDAAKRLARHCESLSLQGNKVSPRTIKQAILSVAKAWCDNMNGSKLKSDPEYIPLYDAQISVDKVCEKVTVMSGL